ncbi:Vacuolar protein-sorting-associated protein 36 [Meyerozyma sp. JA9]|nr:Vacuolar protein-sorting-associated protein 36 [Meyerozyma sp. JA9]
MVSYIGIWNAVSVNRSNRPILEDGEYIVYVKDKVGVYQGQQKILNRQKGRLYLTNRRIIYVDEADPLMSMSIPLTTVESCGIIDGFLRSSAKVRVSIKLDDSKGQPDAASKSTKSSIVDWVCQICSFNNHLDTKTDLNQDFPRCTSCGIPPSRALIESLIQGENDAEVDSETPRARDDQCPKCTFINHPSLRYCELCGCELKSTLSKSLQQKLHANDAGSTSNIAGSDEQAHLNIRLENDQETYSRSPPYVKFSFRAGGEQAFHKHLQEVLVQDRWSRLEAAGAINRDAKKVQPEPKVQSTIHGGGIHGLEQIGEQRRQETETVLSSSLEDLEQLMHRAQDLIKLSTAFQPLIKRKVAYKSIVPPLKIKKSSGLYHRELARHISEYCISGPLSKKSSMISTQDLFARYNRYLVMTQGFGSDLLAPSDLQKVLDLTEELNLPIKVKQYEKSGLVVICSRGASSFGVKDFLLQREKEFKLEKRKFEVLTEMGLGDRDDYMEKMYTHYSGSSVAEIADSFNWSYSIAIEEVESTVNTGEIVVDNSIRGTFYFVNRFSIPEEEGPLQSKEEIWKTIQEELAQEQRTISKALEPKTDISMPQVSNMQMYSSSAKHVNSTLDDLHGLRF